PATIEPIVNMIIIGASAIPEAVADVPVTTWRNSGRNALAAIIVAPEANVVIVTRVTIRLRNRRGGMIGSSARRSCQTKPAVAAPKSATSPSRAGDVQASRSPPQVITSTRAVTPTTSNAA